MPDPITEASQPPADPSGFAARLRTVTWSAHGEAESGGALSTLIGGTGSLTLYRVLLTQLHFVYAELEAAAVVMRADPIAGPFAAPELTRLPALTADLIALGDPWSATESVQLPETEQYVQRLREVATSWSGAFVAHHYTRYLGDLSGGFAVGSAVKRHLGLTETAGRTFFVFDQIANPREFKENYRNLLDGAAWTLAEQDLVAAETLRAYQLNTYLQVAIEREADRQLAEQELTA